MLPGLRGRKRESSAKAPRYRYGMQYSPDSFGGFLRSLD
jgi:hypothetical protein